MQNCTWWCGLNLTAEQIWERENPQLATLEKVKKLEKEISELKNMIKGADNANS
jgi:hypothetical protein